MSRKPVIIDTDPGIDDAVAIAIALFAEELDVRLITTVGGNVGIEHTTDNALKLVTFFKKHVPVAAGAAEPLVRELVDASNVHGASGMEGWEFDEPDRSLLLEKNAVDAMRDALLASEEPVTIIALAPLTNVALTLKAYPEVKSHIERIVLMGGSLRTGLKMYDAHAMAVLLCPEMYELVDTYVGIELAGSMTAGCTLVDLKGYLGKPANATVCMGIDADRFRSWMVERLAQCK